MKEEREKSGRGQCSVPFGFSFSALVFCSRIRPFVASVCSFRVSLARENLQICKALALLLTLR